MDRILIACFLLLAFTGCQSRNGISVMRAPTTDGIHLLQMLDNNKGYAVTYGTGKVFIYNNRTNWTPVAQLDSLYFEQLAFKNDTGWIAGQQGKVFRTNDDGRTWTPFHPVTPAAGNVIYAANTDKHEKIIQLSAGNNRTGKIYRFSKNRWTIDGITIPFLHQLKRFNGELWGCGLGIFRWSGSQWDTLQLLKPEHGALRDIASAGEGKIAAVSSKGFFFSTSDGGKTWNTHPLTNNRLRSIIHIQGDWFISGDKNASPNNFFLYSESSNGWKAFSMPEDIHSLSAAGDQLYAAGKNGYIVRIDPRKMLAAMIPIRNFQGRLEYHISYEADTIDVRNFNRLYGDRATGYFSNGKLRYEFNGTLAGIHWYDYPNAGRWMTTGKKDTLIYTDLSLKNTDSVTMDDGGSGKGRLEKKISLTTWLRGAKFFTETATFGLNEKLQTDHSWYEKINYLSEGMYWRHAGQFPLKRVIDYGSYRVIWTLKKAELTDVDPKVFDLPAGSVIRK